jgi:hypothetical protein
MTAAAVAQRLGLSEAAVAAFSGTGAEFAQFFGKSTSEGEAAVADLATPPGAPTAVVATVTGVTGVSIAFSPPANTGGAPIEGYDITSTPADAALSYDVDDATSPIAVTGPFVQGTAYTFRLKARNSAGAGTNSSASAAVTPNP